MLEADEPAAFEVVEGTGEPPLIVVCDHASNRIPRALASLGLDERQLDDHIAWDAGAAAVARRLGARFGASVVLAQYSRLVIDLNRAPGDATVIPRISDGVLIPGNIGLSPEARAARVRTLFEPYHAAIEALIQRRTTPAQSPAFVGVHSFTPRFHRTARSWQIGVLWDRDPRIAVPLLGALRAAGVRVGDNQPYSGKHPADYCIDTHAEPRGIAHVGIEIRQDLIADEAGQAHWAGVLGDALEGILRDPGLYHAPYDPRR